jgi:hypothetical protein
MHLRLNWFWRRRGLIWLSSLFSLLFLQTAQAHLMVAQRGTLNVVGTGVFVVMSVPVDAFKGVDDDGDGLMSLHEMKAHGDHIEAQVQQGLQLRNRSGPLPLQALMLNLSPDDNALLAPAAQLVVLGRFALSEEQGTSGSASGLTLHFSLFGKGPDARQQHIVVSQGTLRQQLVLGPERQERVLFPSVMTVLYDNATQGADHVLSGIDHLLFLVVVLAAGWGWRQTVGALTCFTLGHAFSLVASVLGNLAVPSAAVEPAIAFTIIGMVLFDRWSARRPIPCPSSPRLVLVFFCALVHGLGLSGALVDLGVDPQHRWASLAGFNVGIELGQLVVAVPVVGGMAGIQRFRGGSTLKTINEVLSTAAMAIGGLWLLQRLAAMT